MTPYFDSSEWERDRSFHGHQPRTQEQITRILASLSFLVVGQTSKTFHGTHLYSCPPYFSSFPPFTSPSPSKLSIFQEIVFSSKQIVSSLSHIVSSRHFGLKPYSDSLSPWGNKGPPGCSSTQPLLSSFNTWPFLGPNILSTLHLAASFSPFQPQFIPYSVKPPLITLSCYPLFSITTVPVDLSQLVNFCFSLVYLFVVCAPSGLEVPGEKRLGVRSICMGFGASLPQS